MAAIASSLLAASLAIAQVSATGPAGARIPPVAEVSTVPNPSAPAPAARVPQESPRIQSELQPRPKDHPLMPILRWASQRLPEIEKLKDYSATLVKRERVQGKLGTTQYLAVKIRQKPLSFYAFFLSPPRLKGQEIIYVEGQNDGKFWVHRPAGGTMRFAPDSEQAMRDEHYPVTEVGISNLVRRLVEVGREDLKYGECEVKYFSGAKINDRSCTVVQVVHPVPRREFRFHLARVFIDDELRLPVRYEAYNWPDEKAGQPELIEEYTYIDLKLNNGFVDDDFSINNSQYHFPARR